MTTVHAAISTAYTAAAWAGFGGGVATAAAALAGLLFVAISINLKQILAPAYPWLPTRAGQTLILFATPLIVAVLLLVPGQGRAALALELLATGLIIGTSQLYLDLKAPKREGGEELSPWRRMLGRVFPELLSCGCMMIAGATLLAQAGGGLYWLVPSVITALIFGLLNVWVLLVEILR
ncbi:MAG TPA: hypothetical protein VEL03_06855 [Streptosporangiaceae bacterium]|nr:hypothetical protein [Streptosporangiaceae bacterium]